MIQNIIAFIGGLITGAFAMLMILLLKDNED